METLTGRQLYSQLQLFGGSRHTPSRELVELLARKHRTIATAESCTGGLISKLITDISGASEVFHCGVCSYSNDIKERVLGVQHEILEQHGAVSPETAMQMAMGVRAVSGADIGLSTTGIAGPGGGSDQKPVGLVYIGYADKRGCGCVRLELWDVTITRDEVRNLSAAAAILMAYKSNLNK
ncbi:MAG: CinA family protein [Acutalibacteraceae bacterium]